MAEKKEKAVSVAIRLSVSTIKRVDHYAREYWCGEKTTRTEALRSLIDGALHDFEITAMRREALRKSLPARSANISAAYTKEAYRVEVLHIGAPSNYQPSHGKRFSDLEEAREYYDSLDNVPQGMRKELQRRTPGKMRYEAIEIEVNR